MPVPFFSIRCDARFLATNTGISVFEHLHKPEIKKAKDESIMTAAQLETIVHPNEYFKRSYLLRNLDKAPSSGKDVKMED